MADISMCKEEKCPRSKECYRFMATPSSHRQSYFTSLKWNKDGCDRLWPMKQTDNCDIETKKDSDET